MSQSQLATVPLLSLLLAPLRLASPIVLILAILRSSLLHSSCSSSYFAFSYIFFTSSFHRSSLSPPPIGCCFSCRRRLAPATPPATSCSSPPPPLPPPPPPPPPLFGLPVPPRPLHFPKSIAVASPRSSRRATSAVPSAANDKSDRRDGLNRRSCSPQFGPKFGTEAARVRNGARRGEARERQQQQQSTLADLASRRPH
ncbi:hypothetical protein CDD83_6007 [Cordyceps sp. RAO-2017]|nr:hypothetical protein CDD83_6007 [Cordyceps sp. RAO-2017]